MKNLKLWMVILPLFTIGCSEEYTGKTEKTSQTSFKKSTLGPENSINPYDIAGNVYFKILAAIDQKNFKPHSIEDVAILIDSVSTTYPELNEMSNDAVFSRKLYEITSIIHCEHTLDELLLASTLKSDTQSSFSLFAASLVKTAEDPYADVYSMIVSYEENVLGDSRLSSEDKRIILTSTSILRYSEDGKRKDKYWETAVTKITETVLKANKDNVLGLKMAATVQICQKYNILE